MTAAGGAAEDGPGAPLAITHGPAAEVLYEGAECDVDMENTAEAPVAAAAEVRPALPQVEWDKMTGWGGTKTMENWMKQGGRLRLSPV